MLEKDQIAALSRRSDIAGLRRLVVHVALLACTATGIFMTAGTWLLVPAMVLHGAVQVALFAGLHETVHRTAFQSRRLNDIVAAAIGLIHVLPATYFRRFHFAHHRYTQDPKRDPELAGPKPTTLSAYFGYVTGFVYWRDRISELFRHASGRVTADFIPASERPGVVFEARCHLAVYLCLAIAVFLGWSAPLYYWALPAVLGQPFLRLYLLAEHTGCPETADMLANTRTTHSNAFVRLLMWNMPYHTEHHAYPGIPFHALPALHALMRPSLKVVASGYGAFHKDYLSALSAGNGETFARPASG